MTYRDRFSDALKTAMKAKDQRTVSTVRLILAKLKDADIAARPKGEGAGVADAEIERLLGSMIKQRRESADLYDQGQRPELAAAEREEIAIIEGFLPQQMSDAEVADAVTSLVAELGLSGPKGMGPLMAALRERFAGRMDFAKASGAAKKALT